MVMSIEEEACRNTYDTMLKLHPDQKKTLDLMLKMRLQQLGVIEK